MSWDVESIQQLEGHMAFRDTLTKAMQLCTLQRGTAPKSLFKVQASTFRAPAPYINGMETRLTFSGNNGRKEADLFTTNGNDSTQMPSMKDTPISYERNYMKPYLAGGGNPQITSMCFSDSIRCAINWNDVL